MQTHDIVIIGGGIVGLTAALALVQKTSLSIALIDAKPLQSSWNAASYESRVSAISLASQHIFQNLKIWDHIQAKRISPYEKMFIWDEASQGQISFDSCSLQSPYLGHIIEDNLMRACLLEQLQAHPQVNLFPSIELSALVMQEQNIKVVSADHQSFTANLVIAADGGQSWARQQVGIDITHWAYAHHALVTMVRTELSHQKTAWQRFASSGPLAFLPLQDPHLCSIVWSSDPDAIQRLLSLNDEEFKSELANAFALKLGAVTSVEKRLSFPLEMRHAKEYVKPRLVLVGDAAHTIHPLAGQGVNLGLLDAACLVDVIQEALAKGRDYASFAILRKYERERKADNVMMLAMVEGLKRLFGSEAKVVSQLRSAGLNLVNNTQMFKNFLSQYAVGQRTALPTLAMSRLS